MLPAEPGVYPQDLNDKPSAAPLFIESPITLAELDIGIMMAHLWTTLLSSSLVPSQPRLSHAILKYRIASVGVIETGISSMRLGHIQLR